MRTLCVLIGLLVAFPAWGGSLQPLSRTRTDASLGRYTGDILSSENQTSTGNSTTDRATFGFLSNWVRICIQSGASPDNVIYFRPEFDASADNWADQAATQSSYYINGVKGVAGLGTRAMTMTPRVVSPVGGVRTCRTIAVQARGLTIHQTSSAGATLDVVAF